MLGYIFIKWYFETLKRRKMEKANTNNQQKQFQNFPFDEILIESQVMRHLFKF